ncbi:hypothetical protein Gogos_014653 [Gossypium gossypioides]|uniref:Uncharacterized protein n=1 Tax=Gossypium gossypioides TaxID=34282 RepID=A0A7J9BZ91_GOSGO|nr:hypothetical protein [Gossypium gossypioides]
MKSSMLLFVVPELNECIRRSHKLVIFHPHLFIESMLESLKLETFHQSVSSGVSRQGYTAAGLHPAIGILET